MAARKYIYAIGLTGCGIFSYYNYVKYIVPTTKLDTPPSNSLLHEEYFANITEKRWSDCYKLEMKIEDKTVSVPPNEMLSTLIAKCLYTSPMFKMEKGLLKMAGIWKHNAQQIQNCNFEINDSIGVWKVIQKNNNEILFQFHDPTLNWTGATYLALHISNKNGDGNSDVIVQFGTASVKPKQLPFIAKILLPFHGLYSRMLLVSMTHTFINHSIVQNDVD